MNVFNSRSTCSRTEIADQQHGGGTLLLREVRNIVEPILWSHGYWDHEYKNWGIFDQFREIVLEELDRLERQ